MVDESRFDEIWSTSLFNYKKTLEDNVFDAFPLFDWMNQKGGRLELEETSNDIQIPLLYGKNSTVQSYSGWDVLDVTPQEGLGNAKFAMKQLAGTVTIQRFQERQNASKATIVKLFNSKMQQLEMSFQDEISEQMFGDGTGNDGKDISGLQKLVADDPTASATVGGIDQSTRSWWRNQTDDGAQSAAAYDNLLADIRGMYLDCSKRKQRPDFGIMPQAIYEAYEGLMTADINFNVGNVNLSVGDLGFDNLKYKGMVITWDLDCPAGKMYFLNSKFLKLNVDKGTNFEPMPFQRSNKQDGRSSMVLWYGDMTVSNRRMQGVLHSIT